jgi:hypothetical protein
MANPGGRCGGGGDGDGDAGGVGGGGGGGGGTQKSCSVLFCCLRAAPKIGKEMLVQMVNGKEK